MSNKQTNTDSSIGDENKAASKKRASRKPSQTAQILANVETLLELHENPGKPDGDFNSLLEQFESLQQESARLNERTNQLVEKLEKASTNKTQSSSAESGDEILEWLESANEETIETLENKFEQKFDKLSEELDTKLDRLSQTQPAETDHSKLLAEQAKKFEEQLESRLECRFEKLNERISDIAEQLKTSSPATVDFDSSSLDEIFAKQTEQLDQSLELLADHVKERTDSAVTEIEAKFAHTLTETLTEKYESTFAEFDTQLKELAASIKTNQNHSGDSGLEFSDSSLELITAAFDTKTSEVVAGINEGLEGRLDELDQRITKVTSAIEGQQALIESVREQSADTEEIGNKTDVIVGTFKNQVDELFEGVGSRIARFSEFLARQELDEATVVQTAEDPKPEESTSHWERQKAAMLSKYGIDPDHRPSNELPGAKNPDPPEAPIELDDQASENLEGLHDSIKSISTEDAEAIEKLKEDLTSKLREAEIELSINRAKLSQQKAELEEKQVEIDRREESLRKKSAYQQASGTAKGSSSMLDRMKKHLGMSSTEQE